MKSKKQLLKSDIGITPTNDGNVIRLAIPTLTEERRKELVKVVKKEAEEAKVVVRNVRRDSNDELKKSEKHGEITEDDLRGFGDDIQKLTDELSLKWTKSQKKKNTKSYELNILGRKAIYSMCTFFDNLRTFNGLRRPKHRTSFLSF